jgi:hypothetical protein
MTIGSSACRHRAWRPRSTRAGIESGRCAPFFLGIYRRRRGTGREPRHRCRRSTAAAFFSGVSQSSPSMPGVFWLAFSVPRLTARTRAANEGTHRERRRLALRQPPACTAGPIRRCRDRTRRCPAAPLSRCQAIVAGSADASSCVPYRLHRLPCLPVGDFGDLRFAPPQRVMPVYHGPRVSPISRGRMPLYTGRSDGCVGLPCKLTDLSSVPWWRWGRRVALAPPASRCVPSRLQCPSPARPFPDDAPVCHSPLIG